ncbi:MAG TPA: flagellar basal body rod C-terminal domain-containing protein, partial [Spirochaetales bacterium]|nr:flagellar basal body rod C-terminal domain-containing protein [Spirochaetales bacterium]
TRYQRLSSTRDMTEQDIQTTVNQVNTYIRQIAALNEEIVKVEAMGDNPNDLYDRRDLLVEKLGQLVPVTTDNRDPNEFMVHVDGHVLVQGKIGRTFETDTDPNNNGYTMIRWGDTGTQAFIKGGSLGSLFELRDGDIREEIALLDTLTLTFTDMVNEIHQNAYGLNGKTGIAFFTEQPRVNNVAGNYDRNGDGVYDSTMLHRMTGSNTLNAQDQVGIAGVIRLAGAQGPITIEYKPTDTVGDIISRINNSGAEVTARLTFDGRLELRGTVSDNLANPDFVIRSVEDSGEFLVGYAGILNASGAEGAFTWDRADAATLLRDGSSFGVAPIAHPAGWIELTNEIKGDITNVAAGFGVNGRPAEVGNGDAALAIAKLRSSTVMVGQEGTFDEYFAYAVGRIGLKGEQADRMGETQARIVKNLTDMRDSISGVNIDEELSNMIKFQHGYAAAAKFIQHFDQMLDTIINRMGV